MSEFVNTLTGRIWNKYIFKIKDCSIEDKRVIIVWHG